MKQFIHSFFLLTLLFFLVTGINIAQEIPGVFKTNAQYKGSNSNDPEEMSGLSIKTERSTEEKK